MSTFNSPLDPKLTMEQEFSLLKYKEEINAASIEQLRTLSLQLVQYILMQENVKKWLIKEIQYHEATRSFNDVPRF